MTSDKNDDKNAEVEEFFKKLFEFTKNFEKFPFIAENFNWYIEPYFVQQNVLRPYNVLEELYALVRKNPLEKLFKVYENESQVDKILLQYYRKNVSRIFRDLKEKFPNRSDIFDEIFYAHKKKLYYLSSIALMTQIDGIVYDIFNGKNYFQGDFFKGKIQMLAKREETAGLYFLKQLFNNELPIRMNQNKRTLEFEHMNRHQMLHGETTDFNTEINSLKALSLLATLAFNMKYLDGKISDGEVIR